MRIRCLLLTFLLLLLAVSGTGESIRQGSTLSGTVRVCLSSISELTEVDILLDGSYTLGESGETIAKGTQLHVQNNAGTLFAVYGGVSRNMGTQMKLRRHNSAGVNGFRIVQARYPDNLYPGDLEIRSKGATLQLIAGIYIEDYLMGVLPYEMDNDFPIEALKAQAVAARTYALKKISMQSSVYDVVDTTSDQVYNGTPNGKTNCEQAVTATSGIVGLIGNEYMATFFTASNGGQTESVKNAWGSNTYKYLTVKPDPYDLKNPASPAKSVSFYRDGTTSVPALTELLRNEAAAKLGKNSVTISAISGVRPTQPRYGSDSLVYRKVEVDLEVKGSGALTVTLDYFAQVEGICALSINSTQNETLAVTETVGGYKLTARRFGHGIGMSQRGAQQMAYEGMQYRDILDFYYSGIDLTRFTFERSLLPSLDGTTMAESADVIDAVSAVVSLKNPLDVLNLRKAASLEASILATIPHGTRVTCLDTSGDWSRIQYGTLSGYVRSEYLKGEQTLEEGMEITSGSGTAVVSLADESQILNLRASPTTAASVLSYLRSGQVLTVIERYSRWTQVQYGSITGYVMNDYIRSPEETVGEGQSQEAVRETASDEPLFKRTAVVLPSTGLNLRLTASVRSAIIMVLPQGTVLTIRGAQNNDMLPVSLGNINGFVAVRYVYITDAGTREPVPEQTPEAFRLLAEVNTESGLILRSGPAQQANAMRLLENGTEVVITGAATNGFFPVIVGNETGYVSEQYLTFLPDRTAPAGTTEPEPAVTATPAATIPAITPTPVPPASRILSGERARVNASGGLNLRSQPNSTASVLAVIGDQVQVIVLGSAENDYYPVRIGTMTGYLSADYLAFDGGERPVSTPTPAPAATPVMVSSGAGTRMIVSSSNGLNLRAEPGKNGEILYVLPYGMVLTVLEDTGDEFIHVRWNNYEGYVSRTYLSPLAGD